MGKHIIKILGGDEYFSRYKTFFNEALNSANYHDAASYLKSLAYLIEWRESDWQVEVDSLEQYFTIIEAVSEVTDGDYNICDFGHTLELN